MLNILCGVCEGYAFFIKKCTSLISEISNLHGSTLHSGWELKMWQEHFLDPPMIVSFQTTPQVNCIVPAWRWSSASLSCFFVLQIRWLPPSYPQQGQHCQLEREVLDLEISTKNKKMFKFNSSIHLIFFKQHWLKFATTQFCELSLGWVLYFHKT